MHFEQAFIGGLRPHPEHQRLFVPLSDDELTELARRMADGGRFQPLLITDDGLILAGVEHWLAATRLGWREISVIRAPRLRPVELRALMVAENIRSLDVRDEHLWRGMNNFFDMEPLRPPGGW
ncbi:hypothetical protein Deba_2804 [Desulfarculus baarsii DSM 2075]|uniref:ParB/Sulfiredoxin domain-containing protein n=2 Tax=Desulfarculus baarsii TaxID=453230 RepID=E1QMB5_DESB2|nr:hypothetical protein Deba_2804 [Desulfarculus baarsii DSM 2075]